MKDMKMDAEMMKEHKEMMGTERSHKEMLNDKLPKKKKKKPIKSIDELRKLAESYKKGM